VLLERRVQVDLLTDDFPEQDNTNNFRVELLPAAAATAPYTKLLGDARIRSRIHWLGEDGALSYSDWTADQKADLDAAILRLEGRALGNSDAPALTEPPTLLPGNFISASDAWTIYLSHVAQSLWVEVHEAVSWSLLDFSGGEFDYLLGARHLLSYNAFSGTYLFGVMGRVTPWDPRICYEFLSNLKVVESCQLETIYALTDWMRAHLIHTSVADDFSDLFGYTGLPPVDKCIYALEGRRHKTAGCWGTSGFYGAVLRSVNVPVIHESIRLLNGVHSRPEFPSVMRSMPHGDDPYTVVLTPSGEVMPSSALFYTLGEMETKFLGPALDCVDEQCNTLGEQASYNAQRDHLRVAFECRADYLLYDYSLYGAEYLDDTLRGPRIGGGVREYVGPLFSDEEGASMVAAVESRVEEIGGGDVEAGKLIVKIRYGLFGSNR